MYPMNPLTVGQATFSPYVNQWPTNPVVPNYQPISQPVPQRQIDCVNGRDSALAFQLGPNSSVILADNLAPKVWVVTTDASGYKAIKGYKIIEDDDDAPIVAEGKVSSDNTAQESKWKQEIETLTNRIDELEEQLNEYRKSNSQYVGQNKSGNTNGQPNARNGNGSK